MSYRDDYVQNYQSPGSSHQQEHQNPTGPMDLQMRHPTPMDNLSDPHNRNADLRREVPYEIGQVSSSQIVLPSVEGPSNLPQVYPQEIGNYVRRPPPQIGPYGQTPLQATPMRNPNHFQRLPANAYSQRFIPQPYNRNMQRFIPQQNPYYWQRFPSQPNPQRFIPRPNPIHPQRFIPQPNPEYPQRYTPQPNREYPQRFTQPNFNYPQRFTQQLNPDYPQRFIQQPNREYSQRVTLLPNPDYPQRFTPRPNPEYPQRFTPRPNPEYPQRFTPRPNPEYPQRFFPQPNPEYPQRFSPQPNPEYPQRFSPQPNPEYPQRSTPKQNIDYSQGLPPPPQKEQEELSHRNAPEERNQAQHHADELTFHQINISSPAPSKSEGYHCVPFSGIVYNKAKGIYQLVVDEEKWDQVPAIYYSESIAIKRSEVTPGQRYVSSPLHGNYIPVPFRSITYNQNEGGFELLVDSEQFNEIHASYYTASNSREEPQMLQPSAIESQHAAPQSNMPAIDKTPPQGGLPTEVQEPWALKSYKKPCFYKTRQEKAAFISQHIEESERQENHASSSTAHTSTAGVGAETCTTTKTSTGPSTESLDTIQETASSKQIEMQPSPGTQKKPVTPEILDEEENLNFNRYQRYYWALYRYSQAPPQFFINIVNRRDDFSHQIWSHFNYYQMSEDKYESNLSVCNKLLDINSAKLANYKFCLTGSMLSGLGHIDSDINLSVQVQTSSQSEETDPLKSQPEAMAHIYKIRELIFSEDEQIATNCSVSSSLSPKLMFTWFRENQVGISMTINDTISQKNTLLNYGYTKCDWRFQPLYSVIKKWAIGEKLCGRNGELLSGYSVSILVIYFLQNGVKPQVLPCIQEHKEVTFPDEMRLNVPQNWDFYWTSKNNMTLYELFKEFFVFYKSFPFQNTVVSINSSASIFRIATDKSQSNLYVAEPFSSHNTIINIVSRDDLKHFTKSMETALLILSRSASLDEFFTTLSERI